MPPVSLYCCQTILLEQAERHSRRWLQTNSFCALESNPNSFMALSLPSHFAVFLTSSDC